jgi:hypothetical protein
MNILNILRGSFDKELVHELYAVTGEVNVKQMYIHPCPECNLNTVSMLSHARPHVPLTTQPLG